VAALADTNVLVYCFDARFPDKQRRARQIMREGLVDGRIWIPHQALMEFVAAVTRPARGREPLLRDLDAWHEVENFLTSFPTVYPTDAVLRTAIQGSALHRLPWFDAHMWAYASCYECSEIYSEDFQHGRVYGRVRAINPFIETS
jgi:predicted nucleic acid-binding protein